ncbi:EAL domain-containing protein [Enterovibrio sp. ZSDZ35]|uniref:EAL domain-containing protein n=1 Tax=Enterovibrio qingdaonensis TaxID=2899818 RepID=A0ABT5QSG5_9GAMM|nr:EAL domain-containing protein [Enterovibrio sp. ZSDZ35]MDD1783925.1 EAL domain-containing protein [Enterovibrio sp. ZSDZ35]
MFKKHMSLVWVYTSALLLILLSLLAQISINVRDQQQQLGLRADAVQHQLTQILPTLIAYYDTDAIQRIAKATLSSEVTYIALTDQITAEKAQWSSPKAVSLSHWFINITSVHAVERDVALIHDGSEVASMTLVLSPEFANQNVAKSVSRFLSTLGGPILVLLIIFTLVLNRGTRAIGRITKSLDSLTEQDFSAHQARKHSGVKSLDLAVDKLATHIQRMINSLHKELKTLNNSMMHDAVSGLPNRQYFSHQLNSWMSDENDAPGAVYLVGLPWLETTYRRYGYVARDETWRLLATSLMSAFSATQNCTIARINDNEVAILLPEVSEEQSHQTLHTLISTFNNEVSMAGGDTNTGFHIGMVHAQGLPGSQMLSLADNALQRAKSQNDVFVFNRGSEEQIIDRETWRERLQTTIKKRELRLQWQPIKLLNGDAVFHQELFTQALIENQWQSAKRLMPYIQLFQKGVEFDMAVIETLALLHKEKALTQPVALNLTDESLSTPGFVVWLTKKLKTSELPAEHLFFEINEASARNNLSACIYFSQKIRNAGAQVGIDHFGRHLQSVEYISQIKPAYVKLDQALNHGHSSENRVFTETLVNIVESMDITIIATGINDNEGKSLLDTQIIDAYQGFVNPPQLIVDTISAQ